MNSRPTAFLVVLIGVSAGSLPPVARADTPLPPPKLKEISSPNQEYCAVLDPRKMTTTVFRVAADGKRTQFWQMYGWFRVVDLADDGEHLIVGHSGMNLLPLNVEKDDILIYFIRRGEIIKTASLQELIRRPANLKRTASHYLWGSYGGLDQDGRYVVETVEDRTIRFDVRTGEPIEGEKP